MIAKNISSAIEASVKKDATKGGIERVLVALSGGPDSVCAAYALKSAGLHTEALHCNFHLRGEESNRDAAFVEDFCKQHSIDLEIIDFDVKAYMAANKGVSLEMACRELRYDWFRKKLVLTMADRIVTGHNADDNIETFFLNLLRGSGTRGLKGMSMDNGEIWRPLLPFNREKILRYIEENNLSFVLDSTNQLSDYRRNFLRNKIIPLFKKEWKGFDSAILRTIGNLESENKIVESVIQRTMPAEGAPLSCDAILLSDAPLLLIKRYISPLQPFVTTPEEILNAIKARKPHIRRWKLPNGMAYLRNGNLFIEIGHSETDS